MHKGFQRKVLAAFLNGDCPLPPADLFDPPCLLHLAESAQAVLDAGATAVSLDSLHEAATDALPTGIDSRDIVRELRKIKGLIGAPDTLYVVKKVGEVVALARLRKTLPLAIQAAKEGDLATAAKLTESSLRGEAGRSAVPDDHFLRRLGRTILADPANASERIPTGLPILDKLIDGGLGGGELGVVVSPPSRGKTTFLINFGAAALLEGKTVAHVSLEMSAAKIQRRYTCKLAGKTLPELRKSPYLNAKLVRAALSDSKGKLRVRAYPPRSVTVRDLVSFTEGADLVVMDYGGLLRSSRSYGERRFEIATCFEELRGLGVREGIPVWTAHQTNRNAIDKKGEINMGDLAECFEVAAVSDFMFSINMDEIDYEEGIARLFVMKNRDEQAMVTRKVYVDWASYQVSDLPIGGLDDGE